MNFQWFSVTQEIKREKTSNIQGTGGKDPGKSEGKLTDPPQKQEFWGKC